MYASDTALRMNPHDSLGMVRASLPGEGRPPPTSVLSPEREVAAELKPEDLWPAAWDGMLYKGVRRALPRETMAMFIVGYNKVLFDEAGQKTPADYYEAGEWTFVKWREVAKAMTKLSDDRFEQVGADLPVFNEGFDISLRSWGLKEGLYDETLTKINLTDPLTYEFANWIKDVVTADKSILKPGESSEFTGWPAASRP